jgi:hypothetical protein
MKSVALIITLLTAIATAGATGLLPVTKATVYSDGRPYPSFRMNATDLGKFLDFGTSSKQTDSLGIREALIHQVDGTFYLYYDGAGPKGWLAHLAVSTDLKKWNLKGPILEHLVHPLAVRLVPVEQAVDGESVWHPRRSRCAAPHL